MSFGEDTFGTAPFAGTSVSYWTRLHSFTQNLSLSTVSIRQILKTHVLNILQEINTRSVRHIVKRHVLNTIQEINTSSLRHIVKTHVLNTIQEINTRSIRSLVKTHVLNTISSISTSSLRHILKTHVLNTLQVLSTKRGKLYEFIVPVIHDISESVVKSKINLKKIFNFYVSFNPDEVGNLVQVKEDIVVNLVKQEQVQSNNTVESIIVYLKMRDL